MSLNMSLCVDGLFYGKKKKPKYDELGMNGFYRVARIKNKNKTIQIIVCFFMVYDQFWGWNITLIAKISGITWEGEGGGGGD